MDDKNNKPMTIDDLAVMVAGGFEGVNNRMDKLEGRMGGLEGRIDKIEVRMEKLETRMDGLASSVNNYLELSDKRYLELKARQDVIVDWVKQIAQKTGTPIDISALEKV